MSDSDNTIRHEAPTRRDYVKYGGAVVGGGLLAGCAGDSDSASTPSDTATETAEDTATPTEEDTSYEACIEPNGCYTFEEVPETIVTYEQTVTDILIALDQTDGLLATAIPDRFPTMYIDQLPGVSFDPDGVDNAVQVAGKEPFYEWNADVHLIDHRNAKNRFELEDADIEELEENVGLFYGSYLRRPDYDGGVYYDLFEGVEKIAEVFQVESNAEALSALHADLVQRIQNKLPPVSERPSIAYYTNNWWEEGTDTFLFDPRQDGAQFGPFHDLETADNYEFTDIHQERGESLVTGDEELLLELNPDVLILHGGLGNLRDAERDYEKLYGPLEENEITSQVTAIQEERAYPIHDNVAGPIGRLFLTEMFAKVLYPDQFGEHPGASPPYEGLKDPLPEDEWLFDRREPADIITSEE